MNPTDTAAIVHRLVTEGLMGAHEGQIQYWHDDIGHLPYEQALAAARYLLAHRTSEAFGPVKPGDLIDANRRIREDRITAAGPMPEPPVDPANVRLWLEWSREWTGRVANGATSQQAIEGADQALGVVRPAIEATRSRPVAEVVAAISAGMRMPRRDEAAASGPTRHVPEDA